MSPSAITIEREPSIDTLTNAGLKSKLIQTAPSVSKYAVTANGRPTLAELDASQLITTLTENPRTVPAEGSPEIATQKVCTDHMLQVTWSNTAGWAAPRIVPYGPFSIMPTTSVLHYSTTCFEGLKLYRGSDNKLRLFRPLKNCQRLARSSVRIALPSFDPEELLKLLVALCKLDGSKWLPRRNSFLYVRPTVIGTDDALGVQQPREAMLYIILCLFPSMDKIPRGMRLVASREDAVRAWPGGFGAAKVGANYGPTLLAQGEAKKRGFDQVLWLFGKERWVTEAGASNFFVVWKTRNGDLELITAPLGENEQEKMILAGITRMSILELARDRLSSSSGLAQTVGLESLNVVERNFRMQEIVEAAQEGRLVEAFAAGTAFFIAPASAIQYGDLDLTIPMGSEADPSYAAVIKQWLAAIMWGGEQHEWGLVIEEQ